MEASGIESSCRQREHWSNLSGSVCGRSWRSRRLDKHIAAQLAEGQAGHHAWAYVHAFGPTASFGAQSESLFTKPLTRSGLRETCTCTVQGTAVSHTRNGTQTSSHPYPAATSSTGSPITRHKGAAPFGTSLPWGIWAARLQFCHGDAATRRLVKLRRAGRSGGGGTAGNPSPFQNSVPNIKSLGYLK
jgi:hypothetical protein